MVTGEASGYVSLRAQKSPLPSTHSIGRSRNGSLSRYVSSSVRNTPNSCLLQLVHRDKESKTSVARVKSLCVVSLSPLRDLMSIQLE